VQDISRVLGAGYFMDSEVERIKYILVVRICVIYFRSLRHSLIDIS